MYAFHIYLGCVEPSLRVLIGLYQPKQPSKMQCFVRSPPRHPLTPPLAGPTSLDYFPLVPFDGS